jgi:hypothetical protein
MKKLIFIALLALGINAKAQITLEHHYSNTKMLKFVKLSPTDNKWAAINANTITLYNLNHSIFTTISIPNSPISPYDVLYISKSLFDTDSTTIEYMVDYVSGHPNGLIKIYREDGTVLFSDSNEMAHYPLLISSSPTRPIFDPIVNTIDGPKLITLIRDSIGNVNDFKVYDLPSIYYQCFAQSENNNNSLINISNPYPNPTNNMTTVEYYIPDGIYSGEIVFYNLNGIEVKRYKVDKAFNNLLISTNDIPAGTYFYQLQSAGLMSNSKKLIVIK